ncbi:MAG: DUF3997 domain-containing protein [Clostridia bacterium]|nr:DUF3997 domain-containing protein [Clostridia bacterium]
MTKGSFIKTAVITAAVAVLLFSVLAIKFDKGTRGPNVHHEYSLGLGFWLFSRPNQGGAVDYYHNGSSYYGNPYIGRFVTMLAWDERYILAYKEKLPPDAFPPDDDPQAAEEGYYIIDKAQFELYGPFDEKGFEEKRTELNVTPSLKLKDVATYYNGRMEKRVYFNDDYRLIAYPDGSKIRDKDSKAVIGDYVSEHAFDGRYILAKRNDLKRALPEEYKNDYRIPDENSYEYYIVDTKTNTVYGGYNEEEFAAKRKELNISKRIKLIKVEKYYTYWYPN